MSNLPSQVWQHWALKQGRTFLFHVSAIPRTLRPDGHHNTNNKTEWQPFCWCLWPHCSQDLNNKAWKTFHPGVGRSSSKLEKLHEDSDEVLLQSPWERGLWGRWQVHNLANCSVLNLGRTSWIPEPPFPDLHSQLQWYSSSLKGGCQHPHGGVISLTNSLMLRRTSPPQ